MNNVYLCTITEIDLNNQKQIDFSSRDSQYSWFDRQNTRIVETNVNPDSLLTELTLKTQYSNIKYYDYMFMIDENGDRLFFFILDKKKRGENCIIYVKLDVFQTYMFRFKVLNSFVERCHVPRWINDNTPTSEIVDEGLPLGSYIYYQSEKICDLNNSYVIASTAPLGKLKGVDTGGNTGGSGGSGGSSSGSIDVSGMAEGGVITKKGYRFIKGWEGFAPNPYQLSSMGENFKTAGYGVTQQNQEYYNKLAPFPTSESTASDVLALMILKNYAQPLWGILMKAGVDKSKVKAHHWDAFVSLAYNGGIGAVTESPMWAKYQTNPDDPTIGEVWKKWYIKNNNGEVVQGLKDRREKEASMYTNGIYTYRPIAKINSNGSIVGTVSDNNGNGYIPDVLPGEI